MRIIFGGYYQGKLDYVKKTYKLKDDDVYVCEVLKSEVNFNKKVVANFELFLLKACQMNVDLDTVYREIRDNHNDLIIIYNDLSSQISINDTMDSDIVKVCKFLNFLCEEATHVTRVFTTVPIELKKPFKEQ